MRARRKENFISLISLISLIGVGLGVASLIVVLAVLAGFESNLKEKFLGITSHVVIMRVGGGIDDWPGKVEKLKGLPGVKNAEPFVYGQALASGPGGPSGVMIKGVNPDEAAGGQVSNMSLTPGALEFLRDSGDFEYPPIILGRELSYQLNVYQYDEISVISPFGRITPLGSRAPLTRRFQVAGTFHSGLYEYDSNMAYMSIPEAQSLMAMENDEVSTIELMVDDIYKADKVKEAALAALGGEGFWARDWMQTNINLFAALKLEQSAMFLVLTLTIVVAAFNIVATLVMMVTEKRRDIAILKSMGATGRQIRRVFTIQGMSVGLMGTLGGLAVGVGLCLLLRRYKFISLPPDIYMMDSLPVEMRPMHLVLTVAVTLLISYLATIYPSRQAARLDPAEALRYE